MTKFTISIWRLPNVQGVRTIKWHYHDVLYKLGFNRKIRQLSFTKSHLNSRTNLRLWHDQKLLLNQIGKIQSNNFRECVFSVGSSRSVEEGRKYFQIAWKIIRENPGYLIYHLHKLNLNYGRTMCSKSVQSILLAAREKILKKEYNYDMKRVWIQAPHPKNRSLTIPNIVDRLIASMWTEILELYLKGLIASSNHGFQSGKGCHSALSEILTKQNDFKFMYEFDLENFFPTVSHQIVSEILESYNIPGSQIKYFLLPLQKKPSLDLKLEIPDHQSNKESNFFANMFEKVNNKKESNFVLNKARNIGVPMGLGYSPLLAMLVLCEVLKVWKNKNNWYVTYADDGILLTNVEKDIEYFKMICKGYLLKVNEEKSSYCKSDGLWLKEYKFLGLIYNPFTDTIKSETRKGTSISWDNKLIHWRQILDHGLFGSILARLYSPLIDIQQHFALTYNSHSICAALIGRVSSNFSLMSKCKSLISNSEFFYESISSFSLVRFKDNALLNSSLNCYANNCSPFPLYLGLRKFQEFINFRNFKRTFSSTRKLLINYIWYDYDDLGISCFSSSGISLLVLWKIFFKSLNELEWSIFNQSTRTSHYILHWYQLRIRRVRIVNLNWEKRLNKDWKAMEKLIEYEKTNLGRIHQDVGGPIYESQIGSKNFNKHFANGGSDGGSGSSKVQEDINK